MFERWLLLRDRGKLKIYVDLGEIPVCPWWVVYAICLATIAFFFGSNAWSVNGDAVPKDKPISSAILAVRPFSKERVRYPDPNLAPEQDDNLGQDEADCPRWLRKEIKRTPQTVLVRRVDAAAAKKLNTELGRIHLYVRATRRRRKRFEETFGLKVARVYLQKTIDWLTSTETPFNLDGDIIYATPDFSETAKPLSRMAATLSRHFPGWSIVFIPEDAVLSGAAGSVDRQNKTVSFSFQLFSNPTFNDQTMRHEILVHLKREAERDAGVFSDFDGILRTTRGQIESIYPISHPQWRHVEYARNSHNEELLAFLQNIYFLLKALGPAIKRRDIDAIYGIAGLNGELKARADIALYIAGQWISVAQLILENSDRREFSLNLNTRPGYIVGEHQTENAAFTTWMPVSSQSAPDQTDALRILRYQGALAGSRRMSTFYQLVLSVSDKMLDLLRGDESLTELDVARRALLLLLGPLLSGKCPDHTYAQWVRLYNRKVRSVRADVCSAQ